MLPALLLISAALSGSAIPTINVGEVGPCEWFDAAAPDACPDRVFPLTGKTATDAAGVVWSFGTRQGYHGFELLKAGTFSGVEASSIQLSGGVAVGYRWHLPIPWDGASGIVGIPQYFGGSLP